jgi:hypothetical protein
MYYMTTCRSSENLNYIKSLTELLSTKTIRFNIAFFILESKIAKNDIDNISLSWQINGLVN